MYEVFEMKLFFFLLGSVELDIRFLNIMEGNVKLYNVILIVLYWLNLNEELKWD